MSDSTPSGSAAAEAALTGPVVPQVESASIGLGQRDDDELMFLAAAGSRRAFGTLVERHLSRLTSFCGKWTGDPMAGEELAQEVWLEIWKRRQSYQADGRFLAFLYAAARNRCKNHRRWHWRRGARSITYGAEDLDAVSSPDPSCIDNVIEREQQRRLHRSLAGLAEKHREAVLLRFGEELEYEDIARIVGANASTVRSRVFHGIKLLKTLLAKELL